MPRRRDPGRAAPRPAVVPCATATRRGPAPAALPRAPCRSDPSSSPRSWPATARPPPAATLQHALKQPPRLAHRRRTHAVGFEFEPEPIDDVRRQLPQRDRAEPREHVRVPDRGVALAGRPREVRLRVQPPPLLAELG